MVANISVLFERKQMKCIAGDTGIVWRREKIKISRIRDLTMPVSAAIPVWPGRDGTYTGSVICFRLPRYLSP